MKLIPTLLLAASLTAGSAFAATTPTATPASTATPAAATSAKKDGMHCVKQAHEKKLTGDAEKAFVKECRAGKKPA